VKNKVVLAVDDDVRIRESIARLGNAAGWTVLTFPSGEALLASSAIEGAHCVISDVRMPGMDGLELQRRLKAANPKLPVILITGRVDEQVRQRALREGALSFLYKPFDGEELLREMQRAVEQRSET